jgi:membrane protein
MALSLAPTLVILLAIAGLLFSASSAENRLILEIQGLMGREGAQAIQAMIEGAHRPRSGIAAILLGLVPLFIGATAAGQHLKPVAPPRVLILTVDWVVFFIVITVLFAFIFKVLPNVSLEWGDVIIGAVLTSFLFTAGKSLLGVYLGKAGFSDTYGAPGSLVILLVWVYYSAQVLFFGAEFTRAYAWRFGSISHAQRGSLSLSAN